ncbi:conserved hypothetical protein [Neospora caninum Liverpool]|uniref:Uncharacterized protein n=1 Tax=Neospora caninum (strain Liverpool) TaxID=572307 RepID=F0VL67_NEOCL|nr:conserved hypothetical protein [Neospora caninum Liverpool]CBZ54819.1 conserved hypothetical protein [Neospora caninum Liverpool]CEL69538.1 TPA: hypothetical protein BN1204_052450 [Neospora caninum Liverpool]|eukprot:XP_003884847.1 conserved hypothetical protein [Neospora caninum Liverpool]
MPLEVLGPLAVLAAGMKALPGAVLLKTGGAAAAAKGSGVFVAKSKGVFAATHGSGASSGATSSHEALEKAKNELQKAANDIDEAESTAMKSIMPLGFLTTFGFGGNDDAAISALCRARAKADHGGDRRVRLSTVPDRCTYYGDFL